MRNSDDVTTTVTEPTHDMDTEEDGNTERIPSTWKLKDLVLKVAVECMTRFQQQLVIDYTVIHPNINKVAIASHFVIAYHFKQEKYAEVLSICDGILESENMSATGFSTPSDFLISYIFESVLYPFQILLDSNITSASALWMVVHNEVCSDDFMCLVEHVDGARGGRSLNIFYTYFQINYVFFRQISESH